MEEKWRWKDFQRFHSSRRWSLFESIRTTFQRHAWQSFGRDKLSEAGLNWILTEDKEKPEKVLPMMHLWLINNNIWPPLALRSKAKYQQMSVLLLVQMFCRENSHVNKESKWFKGIPCTSISVADGANNKQLTYSNNIYIRE